jgi:rSAM/selenodomain-associated transferase 2
MISIIIPVLDEVDRLPGLLAALRAETVSHEIIVVDGGSRDRTFAVARQLGAVALTSEPGRGNQICRGVAAASCDILLFLHADTIFPPGGLSQIVETLAARPDIAGGNFRLQFDGDTCFSRGLTPVYGWIRRWGLYYGDSGIFVRRSAYEAIGGMRPIPLMEDFDFVRRMERYGRTCCIADPPLVTSSRRFQQRHAVEITYGWIKLHLLFWLGLSPDRLARIYARQQPGSAQPISRRPL